jgi:hypothetical protein
MNRLTIEKRVQVISALVEGNSLSPAECIWMQGNRHYRPSRSPAHLYQLRRAPEPNHAHVYAAFYSANERIFKKD